MTRPAVRRLEQAGDVQQRRLARARRPDQRHRLARIEVGVAPLQHRDLAVALAEDAVHIAQLQHGAGGGVLHVASLVAQRFDGIEPRGAPGGIEGGQHRQHQRHEDDDRGRLHVDVGRQPGQVVDLGVEQAACWSARPRTGGSRRSASRTAMPSSAAGQRADHADAGARDQEHAHDGALGGAHGAQDADLAALVLHQHDQAGDDVEGRHHARSPTG